MRHCDTSIALDNDLSRAMWHLVLKDTGPSDPSHPTLTVKLRQKCMKIDPNSCKKPRSRRAPRCARRAWKARRASRGVQGPGSCAPTPHPKFIVPPLNGIYSMYEYTCFGPFFPLQLDSTDRHRNRFMVWREMASKMHSSMSELREMDKRLGLFDAMFQPVVHLFRIGMYCYNQIMLMHVL